MAKNKIFNRCFLLIVIFSYSSFLHAGVNTLTTKVVKAYTEKIGVKEKTGRNDGPEVEYILRTTGLNKGDAWCAAFVYTCFFEAGVKGVPRSGYSPNWFPKSNTFYVKGVRGTTSAQQADVFGIYIQSKGRIGHVGFIDSWPDGSSKCITVEGNTSLETNGGKNDHDGQGVERKRRLKSQIYKVSRWL